MKIFISYGHNDHTALVDRLFDALLEAGHEPWKDDRYEGSSGIYAGEDFTQVIYGAIDASDFVVAMVSEVTQTKPYCRDERQYAYNNKGSHFIQIRLDHVQLRLGNANSYIDMSDVETANGTIDEALFQKQLQALFAAFRDPTAFCSNGLNYWAKFETHLKIPGVLKYHEFVGLLDSTPFVGRQWLRRQCVQWATDDSIDCRLFVILGEAGTGKTAFIRHLAADHELVKSVHVCIYDRPSTRSAKDTLKDLAYILAQNNDAYFNFLKDKNLEPLSDMGVDGLFEFLFIEPLKNEQNKYLLIIDGLDELEELTGLNPLMKLFRQYATRINPNISFLVTGRPDENILNKLRTIGGGTPPEQVILDPGASREDLAQYIEQQLQALGQYSPALAEKLLEACDGNFEYLTLLFREASREGLTLTEDMKMPKGLNERYTQYLDRRMEAADQRPRFTREQRKILSVLCAAEEPLPLSLLARLTDMDPYDIQDEISILGSLIRQAGDDADPMICLFTKGFRDYLLDRSCSAYCASRDQGNEQIARYIMDNCQSEKALRKYPYLDRNAYIHLLVYGSEEPEEVCDFIRQQAREQDVFLRIANALSKGNAEAISTYCSLQKELDPMENVIRYLKGAREKIALLQICAYREAHNDHARAWVLYGDIDRMDPSPQAFEQALIRYTKALSLAEAEGGENPNYQQRRILAICNERMGILTKRPGTRQAYAAAMVYYQKVMALNEANFLEKPCYQSRRDLAVSCEHLGLLHKFEGDKATAERYFLRCLDLSNQNYAEAGDYHCRRDLMFNYRRLASLCQGTRQEETRQWQLKALEMCEQNYRENPCFESCHDLSITCDALGLLANNTGDRSAAKAWFLRCTELDKENCEEKPCYQSRQDLAISYTRMGNLAKATGTPAGLEEAEAWFRKTLPLFERNCADNPTDQTRDSLCDSYRRLLSLTMNKDTPESLRETEELLRKCLSLTEENYAHTPSRENRQQVINVCYQLSQALKQKKDPAAATEMVQLLERMLELQQQQHDKNATAREELYLVNAYLSLAYAYKLAEAFDQAEKVYRKLLALVQKKLQYPSKREQYLTTCYTELRNLATARNTIEGQLDAQIWEQKLKALQEKAKKAFALSPEDMKALTPTKHPQSQRQKLEQLLADYAEAPTPQLRTSLVKCYTTLSILEDDGKWLDAALPLALEDYAQAPSQDSRKRLSLVYRSLAKRAEAAHTPQGDEAARQWYSKELELALIDHREAPTSQTSAHLSLVYRPLVALAKRAGGGDFTEADRLQQEYLALCRQDYAAEPSYANWQKLTDAYRSLCQYALEKGTPEGMAEADKWQALYDKLWEKGLTQI